MTWRQRRRLRLDEVEAIVVDALDTAAVLDGEDGEMLRDVAQVMARVAFRSKARDPRVRMKVLVGLRARE